uniref:Uncharacterized protein n=1 Tax=Anguilla anguilla TaxID=7936 RepID=A0A0E9W2T6_ANGAN
MSSTRLSESSALGVKSRSKTDQFRSGSA